MTLQELARGDSSVICDATEANESLLWARQHPAWVDDPEPIWIASEHGLPAWPGKIGAPVSRPSAADVATCSYQGRLLRQRALCSSWDGTARRGRTRQERCRMGRMAGVLGSRGPSISWERAVATGPQQRRLSLRHNVQGTVYVLHFEPAYKHAQHYVGWTEGDVVKRVAVHLQGRGSPLIRAAVAAGVDVHLAATYEGTLLESVSMRRIASSSDSGEPGRSLSRVGDST